MEVGRRISLTLAILVIVAIIAIPATAQKNYAPGITDTEIKIGQTMPYSGSASAWGTVGRVEMAYFKMINDQGGINGRKIKLISLDDGYSPPKTVEQTRKLIEEEGVAFIFNSLGGSTNLAVRKYLNEHRVPQLFALAAMDKLNDPLHFPWTIGYLPPFYLQAKIHARHILSHRPNAKIAILYQNDELGKQQLRALKDEFGDQASKLIFREQSYEVTDPTIDSQMVSVQGSGADTFYNATSPKFSAQAIRKAGELGWKPLHFLTYGSSSVSAVLEPAGLQNAVGIISAEYWKDVTDPRWKEDQDVKDYLGWQQKYYPEGKASDYFVAAGYFFPFALVHVLKQCGDELSRESIMRQATNLQNVSLPLLLPGITLNTSPTDYQPIKELREIRFNGTTWEPLEE